jgi:DNA-binding winged helix-turn-helix (wHTH) protein/Tol biopolymer transport system component
MARNESLPIYKLAQFRFDSGPGLLTRDGERIALTPKAAQVLRVLLEHHGKVVTKDTLLNEVWPETHVQESSLTFQMSVLRRALGDDAGGQRYIRTLPKRGYQFVADVSIVEEQQTDIVVHDAPPPVPAVPDIEQEGNAATVETGGHSRVARYWGWAAAVAVFTLVVVLAKAVAVSPTMPPRVRAITPLTHDGREKGDRLLTDGHRVFYSEDAYIKLGDTSAPPLDLPKGFLLLDLSKNGAEALAIRPRDRGAEDALWIVPLGGGQPRRLGMLRARNAAWSNDGRRIAYTYENSVYFTDSNTASVSMLATTAGVTSWPQWSRDDRFIRFTVTAFSDRTARNALWDVNVDGGEPTKVFDDSSDTCCGRWMSDGREFVFRSRDAEGQMHLWLLREHGNMFGRRERQLIQLESERGLNFITPLPSLDDKRIFAIAYARPQLVRYDAERRELVPFFNGLSASAADFSRDGTWVAYVALPTRTLWRAQSDGSNARQLTFPPIEVIAAAWSPDGARIALVGRMPGKREKVYVMPSEGGSPEPLVADDVAQGIPSWSPDGMRLTFGDVAERWGHPTGSEAITIYDFRTRDFSFVPESTGLWMSRWSPDGRYLAALTTDKSQTLKLFDFTTKTWRQLGASHMNHLTWSRDSKWVYCDPEGPEHRFRRVRIPDGFVETLVDLTGYTVPWGGVTLDGSPLITRVTTDIYALELERR